MLNNGTPNASRFGRLAWLWLSLLVFVVDQASKFWFDNNLAMYQQIVIIPDYFSWTLAYNTGAAFSFLADQPGWQRWFFTILALGVSAWMAVEIRRHPEQKLLSLALALVMGGALGNVVDRVRFGAVVDFIQWHAAGLYWPAFNVADSAITVGAILLVFAQLTGVPHQEKS